MLYRRFSLPITLSFGFIFMLACKSSVEKNANLSLFQLLSSSETGIRFTNRVEDSKEMNILNYHNFYNGGGVAIGDINNDGKPDVFLTANQGENKLYLNKGNFQFEDITTKSKIISKHSWHTGVTMVDINGDGWLDIYVCNAGILPNDDRSNELYINQKDGSFTEEASLYGLDDKGASTQALFFDFDHDSDLDCFVLNNSPKSVDNFGYKSDVRVKRDPINGDRLYKNEGNRFIDISEKAGIYGSEIAFGLGISVGDINKDGWEDIYVANDFFEHDYLYINQQNGTFKEMLSSAMGHTSNGAMGTDLADINNDGYLDIFTAEMLPENDQRLKTTIKFDNYDIQNAKNQLDLHHQFTGNTLQLNNQDGTFSEIAQLAGIEATGWSWGTLSFDFDNDGWKDIFVCNGIQRDLTNQDFLAYFNSQEIITKIKQGGFDFMDLLNKMPSVPIPNFAFTNQRNLFFKNESAQLGFDLPTFSSGAAYGDLDGDGDLDLVVNNQNAEASVYKNGSSQKQKNHFLSIQLKGNAPNTFGYGAAVTVFTKGTSQLLEQMPTRGFQSSVEPVLHFGLNTHTLVDSIIIHWPNQTKQILANIAVDTTLILEQKNANLPISKPVTMPTWFQNTSAKVFSGNTLHKENEFVDFDVERLIPKLVSTEGPKLAVGDLNGDGLQDFYMGSAMGDTAKIFIQDQQGRFIQKNQPSFIADNYFENTGAELFDADADGDLDLVVASGGNQAKQGSPFLFTRLYLNDGKANYIAASTGWPSIAINASCIRVGDFNNDSKLDIFIGARTIPGSYGISPSSVLLQNMGNGLFIDVTKKSAPELEKLGMVTDAKWADIDGDKRNDLVIVGDWMPVSIFSFVNNTFSKISTIPHSSGWWNCITIADMNGDRKLDVIAGNFGLNSNIKANQDQPARLFVDDFDKNGQTESIPVYYKSDGKAYPYYLKEEMESQLPQLKKKFLRYEAYAGKSIEQILSKEQIEHATILSVEQTQTSIFMNEGNAQFRMQPLPIMAQLSPVYGITVTDLSGDGKMDMFMAGNFYGVKPQTGRLDASYGTTLINKGNDEFKYHSPKETGLFLNGEARDLAQITSPGGIKNILVSMNNDKLYFFKKVNADRKTENGKR